MLYDKVRKRAWKGGVVCVARWCCAGPNSIHSSGFLFGGFCSGGVSSVLRSRGRRFKGNGMEFNSRPLTSVCARTRKGGWETVFLAYNVLSP